jgi:transcriptional regulator with XRE-family HTH domain
MELGYRIKKIRQEKKYSQQEIADYLNISQKMYSNFESCKTQLSIIQLFHLSKILSFNLFNFLKNLYNDLGIENINSEQTLDDSISAESKDALLVNYINIIKDKDEIISLLKEKIKRISDEYNHTKI